MYVYLYLTFNDLSFTSFLVSLNLQTNVCIMCLFLFFFFCTHFVDNVAVCFVRCYIRREGGREARVTVDVGFCS
jgi:hypothetical protein